MKVFARLCLATLALGCLAVPAAAQPAVCKDANTLRDHLRLETRDVADAGVTIMPGADPDALRLRSATAVLGECAAAVESYVSSMLVLEGGTLVVDTAYPASTITGVRRLEFARASVRTKVHPDIEGAQFIAAARVDFVKGGENLIGVWRRGSAYHLYAYQVLEERANTPTLLLTSRHPLRGVGFFPSPDTPSGAIGLIQVAGDEMRALSLSWHHPDVFPRIAAPAP